MGFQRVCQGVDTLKVSAVGSFKPEVVMLLDVLQQKAMEQRDQRRHNGEVLAETHWALDGQLLLILTAWGRAWEVDAHHGPVQ